MKSELATESGKGNTIAEKSSRQKPTKIALLEKENASSKVQVKKQILIQIEGKTFEIHPALLFAKLINALN